MAPESTCLRDQSLHWRDVVSPKEDRRMWQHTMHGKTMYGRLCLRIRVLYRQTITTYSLHAGWRGLRTFNQKFLQDGQPWDGEELTMPSLRSLMVDTKRLLYAYSKYLES